MAYCYERGLHCGYRWCVKRRFQLVQEVVIYLYLLLQLSRSPICFPSRRERD
jgi:hypothetical protein